MPDYLYGALRLSERASLVGGSAERLRASRLDASGGTDLEDVELGNGGIIIAAGVREFTRGARRFLVVPASGAEIMGPDGHVDLAPGIYEIT